MKLMASVIRGMLVTAALFVFGNAYASPLPLFTYTFEVDTITPINPPDGGYNDFVRSVLNSLTITMTHGEGLLAIDLAYPSDPNCIFNLVADVGITAFSYSYPDGSLYCGGDYTSVGSYVHVSTFANGLIGVNEVPALVPPQLNHDFEIFAEYSDVGFGMSSDGLTWSGVWYNGVPAVVDFTGAWVLTRVTGVPEPAPILLLLAAAVACVAVAAVPVRNRQR